MHAEGAEMPRTSEELSTQTGEPERRKWLVLGLVCAAFFMTVLDVSIVNVALPSIGRSLEVGESSLQWIITAYAITFGGFLLLGGRAGDLLGRKRVFMVGLVLFAGASLVCGLASSIAMLDWARAAQGLGAAIITPATLSIIMTTFREGKERNTALGIWGAMGGSGAAAGVIFGGVLTKYLGWEWIFFVNVPVAALLLALTPRLIRESRVEGAKNFDAAGAVSVTAGLALLVYAISNAPHAGWLSGRKIGELIAASVLLVLFVFNETRASHPLMPLRIFRVRTLSGANAVGLILGAVVFSNFFLLTLYVQQVLLYSALKTGITFLATAGTVVLVAGLSQKLVTKIGAKPVMVIGMVLITAGLLWYTQIGVSSSYATALLPGYLLVGFGIAFAFIPVSIAALAGVKDSDAGLASGILNTAQQIGGALGVAIAATIVTTHATTLLKSGQDAAHAYTSGFALSFWVIAGLSAVGTLVAIVLVRSEDCQKAEVPKAEAPEAEIARPVPVPL
jgi:EmrB/QacA subfamily drug resistance transporter